MCPWIDPVPDLQLPQAPHQGWDTGAAGAPFCFEAQGPDGGTGKALGGPVGCGQ